MPKSDRLEELTIEAREEAKELLIELRALQREIDVAGMDDAVLPLLVQLRHARAMEALAGAYADLADAQTAAVEAAMGAADDDDDE